MENISLITPSALPHAENFAVFTAGDSLSDSQLSENLEFLMKVLQSLVSMSDSKSLGVYI